MNTTDRRRNLGPPAQSLKFEPNPQPVIAPASSATTPKIFIKTGTVKTCNGSSYLESDSTIVTTTVYGPRPSFTKGFNNQASLRITLGINNFGTLDSLKINPDALSTELSEKQLTSVIQSFITTNCLNLILLEKYPKSAIEIFVDIIALNTAHSLIFLLSVIQNGVNVALMDSGLNLRSVPACGYFSTGKNEVLVNCCHGQNYDDDDDDDEGEEILGIYSNYDSFDDQFSSGLNKCISGAKELRVELNRFFTSSEVTNE